jgi:chromosome segregation ATPase
MHAVKNGKKRGFKCDRHTLSHDSCIGAYISLPKLERIVAAELYVLSQELLDEEALEERINPFPELADMKKTIEDDIRSLEHEIDSSQTAIRSLYMSKIRGGIGEQEYIDQAIRVSEEKNFMENKVAELKEQIAEIEQTIAIYHNRKLLVRQYVDTRTLTKEMVSVLVDHILVGRRDPVTKETPIEIHWNF